MGRGKRIGWGRGKGRRRRSRRGRGKGGVRRGDKRRVMGGGMGRGWWCGGERWGGCGLVWGIRMEVVIGLGWGWCGGCGGSGK